MRTAVCDPVYCQLARVSNRVTSGDSPAAIIADFDKLPVFTEHRQRIHYATRYNELTVLVCPLITNNMAASKAVQLFSSLPGLL